MEGIGAKAPFIFSIIVYLLLFVQALGINNFVNKQRLLQKQGFIPAMAYLLITSFFNEWNSLSSVLIVNTIVVLVLNQLMNLAEARSARSSLLNIGILLGAGSFIYFPSLAFGLLVFLALTLTRKFSLNEWLMVLLGIFTPIYFLAGWLFLTDKWKGYRFPGVELHTPQLSHSPTVMAGIVLLGLLFILGIYLVQKNFLRLLVQTRKSWNVIYLYLLVAIFIPFINTGKSFTYWLLAAVPLAVIISGCFVFFEKKWVPVIIHWMMVAYIITAQYILK